MIKHLPILQRIDQYDLRKFIDFWSEKYNYPLENIYLEKILKPQFDRDDIQLLYIWKNGMTLSQTKLYSLENKINAKLSIINTFKECDILDKDEFFKEFNDVSFVWKIFLLHLIRPNEFPIYDQHIHRAYQYIHGHSFSHISHTIPEKQKAKFYLDNYLPFIKSLEGFTLRNVDRAFFSFGQFIGSTKNQSFFE